MIKAEFHCHTCYSKDSLVTIQDLNAVARKKGLDRVVVTDHNAIQGALEASALDPSRFIIGEEIMTFEGELIGIFISELVPPGLSAIKTIEILRDQGAFITVAHPFDALRAGGWQLKDLENILPHIDAVEVFNARCMLPWFNSRAERFASLNSIASTVGSDSHTLIELGTATLTLPTFSDPSSLKTALASAQQNTHLSMPWVHLYSRYAAWWKKYKN